MIRQSPIGEGAELHPGRKPQIVVIGSANVDLVARASRLPGPGETITGSAFAMAPGGKSANQAVAAARLGATTHFVGRVGSDMFGEMLIRSFHDAGVFTSHLTVDGDSPTGTALIGVSEQSGENCIIVVPGANGNVSPADVASADEVVRGADAIILSLEIPVATVESALQAGSRAGLTTVLNPAPAMALSESLIALCSILTPNEHEVGILAGDQSISPLNAARLLVAKGAQTVVVTLGANGALVVTRDGFELFVPASTVEHVVDTTAAGDCYTAALTVALAEGAEIGDAMRFASAAASISVTRQGAQSSLPSRTEVEAAMAAAQ